MIIWVGQFNHAFKREKKARKYAESTAKIDHPSSFSVLGRALAPMFLYHLHHKAGNNVTNKTFSATFLLGSIWDDFRFNAI